MLIHVMNGPWYRRSPLWHLVALAILQPAVGQTLFYDKLPGAVSDVGIGPSGAAWVVAENSPGGNAKVYRWNGSTFLEEAGVKGAAITVGVDGLPWLLAADGSVFRRIASGWIKLPGRGMDIAAGRDGSVWLVGWPAQDPVQFPKLSAPVHQWNGSTWVPMGGSGRRISVDPTGAPWIVSGEGFVYRLQGDLWIGLPGRGSDLACGPEGSVWLTGYAQGEFSNQLVYRWNGGTWEGTVGKGVRLAVAPSGYPWVASSNGDLFRMHALKAPVLAYADQIVEGGSFSVTFASQPGVGYALHFKPDLASASWLTVATGRGAGEPVTLADPAPAGAQGIYRVEASAP